MAKKKPNTIEVHAKPGESDERTMARKVLQPSVHAALTVQQLNKTTFGERGMTELVSELKHQMKAVTDGDLSRGEGMLVAQAHTLDELFQRLTRQALGAEYMSNLETYLRLALKAQSNARATWEAISRLQNPSVKYVKQANIAQNQQINVGNTTESEKQNPPSTLLEHEQHERLDTGTQATPIGADQELETVGSVNRAANRRGKK